MVQLSPTMRFVVFDSLGISPPAIWAQETLISASKGTSTSLKMQDANILETDTLAQEKPTITTVSPTEEPDTLTANFRKEFDLSALPVQGRIAITADKTYRCYLNDIYIIGVDGNNFEQVDVVPFEAFGNELKVGRNTLACSVTDYDGPPRYGLRFEMLLEFLPIELSEAVKKISERHQENVDLEKLRQIVILNKNRVIK